MDPFALVLMAGLVGLIVAIWLLGKDSGSGLEQLGMRPAREIVATRARLEAEDLEQMLDVHSARRRARGEAEATVADFERRVVEDQDEQRQRREEYLANRGRAPWQDV